MDDQAPVNLRCSMLCLRERSVLVCRRTDASDRWVLPGGTPRPGEGTAAAVQREVAEETGLQVVAERVAFVLETTSWDGSHHLIEIIFAGSDRDPSIAPRQLEERLEPVFVPLDELNHIGLQPPIAGYLRGFARSGPTRFDPHRATAAYLGNVWREGQQAQGEGDDR